MSQPATTPVTFALGDDHVGVVTVNRPEKRNAMDLAVFDGLHAATARAAAAAAEGSCRAVLLTGAGVAFSAGLDLALFGEQIAGAGAFDDDRIAWLQQAFTGFEDLPVPTVAALKGTAIGAGCQLALACHLRVAAPDVRIGVREARWGLLPDLGAPTGYRASSACHGPSTSPCRPGTSTPQRRWPGGPSMRSWTAMTSTVRRTPTPPGSRAVPPWPPGLSPG